MAEEEKAEVSRRSLLRAGTIVAGVGAAGVATAAIATPAQATDGLPIVQGEANTGGATSTTITAGSVANPTVVLANTTAGAPLKIQPTPSANVEFGPPVGSILMDEYGALFTVGNTVDQLNDNGDVETVVLDPFLGRISTAFSTSTLTITPERWLVTIPNFLMPNGFDGRDFIVPGSANFDSAGRVLPKNNPNVPDLVLDFSTWFYEFGLFGVQGSVAVLNPVSNGFVSLYDSDVWPGTASLNFQAGQIRDGFTQMGFTTEGAVNFKLSTPAILVFDIFAFIAGNGSGRFFQPQALAAARQSTAKSTTRIPDAHLPRKRTS